MKKICENKRFHSIHDRNPRHLFKDMEFQYCSFESCTISVTRRPQKRSILRNLTFINCELCGCTIYPAIMEDILISNLKTHNLLQFWGAVFRHVRFEGYIGRIMISPYVFPGSIKPREQLAFDKANAAYYSTVDWALDIREGRFYECEIQRVPAHLILRDVDTQVVITREKALEGKWRSLDLSKTHWDTSIEFLLHRGDPDVVLVAPKRDPKYRDLLDGLKMLRDAGVAEPD